MQELSYCAQEVYRYDRGLFLRGLSVPTPEREALLTLYALAVELAKIHDNVTEEMIGHIRYAWWQEAIEGLYTGTQPHGQPVLEALSPIIVSGQLPREALLPLVEQYREHFPQVPLELDATIKATSLALIRAMKPEAEASWSKADGLITTHRKRYGRRLHVWLLMKLLLSSF